MTIYYGVPDLPEVAALSKRAIARQNLTAGMAFATDRTPVQVYRLDASRKPYWEDFTGDYGDLGEIIFNHGLIRLKPKDDMQPIKR